MSTEPATPDGKCSVCDCDCEYVTLMERASMKMAFDVTTLRAELAVMRQDRDACLRELDTMGNERMRMQGEIATLSAPRVVTDAMIFTARTAFAKRSIEIADEPEKSAEVEADALETAMVDIFRYTLTAALAVSTEPTP